MQAARMLRAACNRQLLPHLPCMRERLTTPSSKSMTKDI